MSREHEAGSDKGDKRYSLSFLTLSRPFYEKNTEKGEIFRRSVNLFQMLVMIANNVPLCVYFSARYGTGN